MKHAWVLVVAVMLSACAHSTSVTRRKDASLERVKRVVVLPFTDDPFVPGSGLKSAAFFRQAAQEKIKGVTWVGPVEVLKQQGFPSAGVSTQDTIMDAPGAIEPVLGKILNSSSTVTPALSPTQEADVVRQNQADAVVRGAVFYDPGTGMVESMVTAKRVTQAGLAVQVTEPGTGRVLLAFRQDPNENKDHPTANQILQETAQAAAERIERSWK